MDKTIPATQSSRLDADGKSINQGAVLIHVEDGTRGVVTHIGQAGEETFIPLLGHGDLVINMGPGSSLITNKYGAWRHVPRKDQTHRERFYSWLHTPQPRLVDLKLAWSRQASKDTLVAIDGIMSLLPEQFDWDSDGPRPDCIEGALKLLVYHIEDLKNAQPPFA